MSRPVTPNRARGGRTPSRGKRDQGGAEQQLGLQAPLHDATQFPALPAQLEGMPRGRKDRRSCEAWDNLQGGDPNRPSSRSVSRSGRFREEQAAEEGQRAGRSRACSFDLAADSTPKDPKSAPTTPRTSILKKQRPSTGEDEGDSAALAKIQEEMKQKMQEMMALMGKGQASDVQTQMAMQLSKLLDSAATGPEPVSHETPPAVSAEGGSNENKEISMRPRRLSNPRPMEVPGGSSWEFPLSREEKKARVVMISSAQIDSLTEENCSLVEEVARLSIDAGS